MAGGVAGRPRAGERGAAAVEGALVLGFFLVPMLLGLLAYGHYFWQRQKVSDVDLDVSGATIYGSLTCQDLNARLLDIVVDAVSDADVGLGRPLEAGDVDVDVLQALEGVGVDVRVQITLPLAGPVTSILPLPDDGALVEDIVLRLENVQLGTDEATC